MPTLIDVARRAGVSIGTVSNVIRGTARVSAARRKRVTDAIHALGYYPSRIAEPVRVKQSCMLGMVLPDITNPFFPEIMRGAEDRAFERGYLLVTSNTDERVEREKQILSVMRSRRVDGILLAASTGNRSRHIRALIEAGIPVVCLDRYSAGLRTDAVLLDNVRGARECVTHLLASGCERIAILTGPLEILSAQERLRGYKQALAETGHPVSKRHIFEGDYRRESGVRWGQRLARMKRRPDAVFASNGVMAAGLLEALEDAGIRCPEDLRLASVDDVPGESLAHRRLPTMLQPGYEIGSKAANLLMDRVEGRLTGPPVVVRVAAHFVLAEGDNRNAKRDGTVSD